MISEIKPKGMNKMKIQRRLPPSLFIILIMVGMMILPAVVGGEALEDVIVTVTSGQDTSISTSNAINFGSLAPGGNNTVSDAFGLTNVGNVVGHVGATFTTSVSTTYGLTNASYVIGGANVSMQGPGTLTALDNLVTDTAMGGDNDVAADAVEDMWDIKLNVPSGQDPAIYNGTIELTFS